MRQKPRRLDQMLFDLEHHLQELAELSRRIGPAAALLDMDGLSIVHFAGRGLLARASKGFAGHATPY